MIETVPVFHNLFQVRFRIFVIGGNEQELSLNKWGFCDGVFDKIIYDMLGKEVEVLVDEIRSTGSHQLLFDGGGLTSGIYFAQLNTGSVNRIIKLVLCR